MPVGMVRQITWKRSALVLGATTIILLIILIWTNADSATVTAGDENQINIDQHTEYHVSLIELEERARQILAGSLTGTILVFIAVTAIFLYYCYWPKHQKAAIADMPCTACTLRNSSGPGMAQQPIMDPMMLPIVNPMMASSMNPIMNPLMATSMNPLMNPMMTMDMNPMIRRRSLSDAWSGQINPLFQSTMNQPAVNQMMNQSAISQMNQMDQPSNPSVPVPTLQTVMTDQPKDTASTQDVEVARTNKYV
jgi:hypothetical protein